jgi:UDP:flavonoid glycosyltransferase YjiC (YdhE family)
MKILFVGLPNAGHKTPCQEFVNALEAAGHYVAYHHLFVSDESSAVLEHWLARFQAESERWGEKIRLGIDVFQPDLLISELPILVAGVISQEYHLPWVIFSALPYLFSIPHANLFLQASLPEFENKKDHGNLRFIGPVVRKSSAEMTDFVKNKPIVHVTQGTVANDEPSLVETCKEALIDDYHLIAEECPHHIFMPYFDVFITNGGFGGVSLAIYHGIPIICAGETEDKPFVADKVEKAGIGINLRTARPKIRQISAAVELVMNDRSIRERCRELSRLAKQRNLEDAVKLVEEVRI